MRILQNFNEFSATHKPIAFTLGNFDGVHLGHVALLQAMSGEKVALTFSNHPSQILSKAPVKNLLTPQAKLQLLEKQGIETLFLLPFTEEFSRLTAEQFLTSILRYCPFSELVLGQDARLGHDQERGAVVAAKIGIKFKAVPPTLFQHEPISSTRIRSALAQGDFAQVEAMLGRAYSITGVVEHGQKRARLLGFKTLNFSIEALALPPFGVYHVRVGAYHGVANLGLAPTLRSSPLLEVHLLDFNEECYGQTLEVVFHKYLRPEIKFNNLNSLKEQIAADVNHILKLIL